MTKKIVATFNTFIAFLVQLKNRVKARFHEIVDALLSAVVLWLCRHYEHEMPCY